MGKIYKLKKKAESNYFYPVTVGDAVYITSTNNTLTQELPNWPLAYMPQFTILKGVTNVFGSDWKACDGTSYDVPGVGRYTTPVLEYGYIKLSGATSA